MKGWRDDLFLKAVDQLNEWAGRVMGVVACGVILLICYQVITRYVFKDPPIWAYDVIVYSMGSVYVMAGGYALLKNAHVNVDIFVTKLSPRKRAILDLFLFPIFVLSCVSLIWGGWEWAWKSFAMREKSGSPSGIPIYPFRFVIIIGTIMLLLQGIAKFIRDFRKAIHKD